jgi:hypothetical protein
MFYFFKYSYRILKLVIFNSLHELGLIKYTLEFFEICCTVQNVAKCNKIAKTGLKNVFFIKTGFSFILNGAKECVQNAFKKLNKRVKNA